MLMMPTIHCGSSRKASLDLERTLQRYTGIHELRHFNASWCINRKEDSGLGLPPKVGQVRLGHVDHDDDGNYGHLFPRGDDAEKLAAAEKTCRGSAGCPIGSEGS